MATRVHEGRVSDYPPASRAATIAGRDQFVRTADDNAAHGLQIGVLRQRTAALLPALNERLLSGKGSVPSLARELSNLTSSAQLCPPTAMATLPTSQARELLHVLGFVACSIEFFTQEAGHEPGVGVKMIDGLEDAMSALSVSAMLPPNLGLHGYWLANPEAQPLSFTSNPGEAFFRAGVVRINLLHELCVGMLSPLGSGEIPLDAPEAAGALRAAAELQNRVHEVYDTFRDENNITIEFFRSVMRRFLVKFPVHGVEFHSANAANICSQAKLDFVIGTTADFYISHVAERMRYMTPEERSELIERMRAPSILDQVLRRLGITAAEVTAPEAVQRVVGKHPELRSALLGFRQLERAAGGAAGAHFGLISRFLIKPDLDDGLSSVKASHGTGGRSHEETKAVATMRNRHEIARPLSDAIRVVFMHAGTDAA